EADSRTRYVSRLLESHSEIRRFGHLMARLGIRYVGLEHVPDFSRYGFLKRETDLRPVLVGRTFTLYENLAWRGGTYGLQSVIPRAQHEIGSGFDVSWLPVWHRLRASKAPFLGTDRSCADGWRLGDQQPICELGAVAAFRSPRSSQKMWRPEVAIQALGYLLSAIVLGLLALSMRRKRSTRG